MSQVQSAKENVSHPDPMVRTVYKDQKEGIAFMEHVNRKWAEDYDMLKREHQNLRKERDDVENSNQEIRRENARVKTQLDLLQQKYKQENDSFQEAKRNLNIEVEKIRQELRIKSTENGDLQRELVENGKKVEALEEKLEMKEKELENIKRILELRQPRVAEPKPKEEAAVQTYLDSDSEDDPLLRGSDHQGIALLEDINRKLAEDNERLRCKVEELRKERDDVLHKNQEIMKENARTKEIKKRLQCKIEDYQVQEKNFTKVEDNLNIQVRELRDKELAKNIENGNLQMKLVECTKNLESLEDKIEIKEKELKMLKRIFELRQDRGGRIGVESIAWSFGHMVLLLLLRTAVHMT